MKIAITDATIRVWNPMTSSSDVRAGEIDFPMGRCALNASDEVVLRILLSSPDADRMPELQNVVELHLVRFAFREPLSIEWRAIGAKKTRTQGRSPAPTINPFGPIRDPKVRAVIETMNSNRRFPQRGRPREQQGIGSELVPAKAETANRNLDAAGLKEFVDISVGDARQTLRDVGGPVDFVLIDGWPAPADPSLAREVIEILAPQIGVGGYVLNDNAEPDFLEFIRDPANGFISMTLPIKRGTELAVKIS